MHRGIKLGIYGLVLTGLLGGTAAWATADDAKSVALKVDGQQRTIHTSAGTVEGALKSAHIAVGPHDLVAPDEAARIANGSQIVVSRGHLLHLNVNGASRDVWVNADSVDEALRQLGYGPSELVSVSRSKRLDSGVTDLSITSPKHVVFKVDHKVVPVISGGPTVAAAIKDAHLTVGAHDRLSAPRGSALRDGEVVTINRVRYGSSVAQQAIPFDVVKQNDPNRPAGSSAVVQQGQNGVKQITYQLVYVDGKLTGRIPTSSVVVRQPVSERDAVGTQQAPAPAYSGGGGSAQQIAANMVSARGWGNDQFNCLVSLWNKESGWRTDAQNPSGAYGIPQALPGSKMASAGSDWQTNAATQITWGLNYISGVYGTPCSAWAHSQATNWY